MIGIKKKITEWYFYQLWENLTTILINNLVIYTHSGLSISSEVQKHISQGFFHFCMNKSPESVLNY